MKQLIFLTLAISCLSCSKDQRSLDSSSVIVSSEDTLISIKILGVTKDYLVHKSNISELEEFQTTINKLHDELEYKSENKLDITGDGTLDSYEIWIKESSD